MKPIDMFVAIRYLRGKRKIGFISWITYISAGGVFLGSLVLVVALSIANGFEKEVRDRIVGTIAHAKILKYHGQSITEIDSLRKEILKHPDVLGAAPFIQGKGAVEHEQVQEAALVTGIDASLESSVTDIEKSIVMGDFKLDSTESDRGRKLPGMLIGIRLADKMGIRQGAEVVLATLVTIEGEVDPVPQMGRYTVTGIFETGMYEYDLNLIYISLQSAQDLFNVVGAEGIQVKTTDLFRANHIAKDLREMLGGYPYREVDWQSQNKSLFQWMKLERLIIFIVISLIMVVAAFNIVSSLIMMILEKRREIGILMSMGATSGSILRIFMLNGVVIGFIGATLGVGLGVIICLVQFHWQVIPLPGDIYFINKLPVLVRPFDVIIIYIASNIICWSATIYPALQASKMLPAESIRYE